MKKILLILLVSLAAFSSAYSQKKAKGDNTVIILKGDETIKVGDSTYSLKELIEAKRKNEVLEELLMKIVKSDQHSSIIGWDISHDPITGSAIIKVSPVLLKGESIWSNSKLRGY